MSENVWIQAILGLVAIMTSVVAPLLMARQIGRQKAADRDADWARQDAIAERLASKVSETASHASNAREAISTKLDVVTTLVNGNATDAMRREMEATARELAALREVARLKAENNVPIGPVEAAMVEMAEARVSELRAQLALKMASDTAADQLKKEQGS